MAVLDVTMFWVLLTWQSWVLLGNPSMWNPRLVNLLEALSENSDIGGATEHYNHRVCLAFDFFAMA